MTLVDLWFRDVQLQGRRGDVVVDAGRVVAVGLPEPGAVTARSVVEGRGRALLPGLHDHHLHVMALAASQRSLDLESTRPRSRTEFEHQMRRHGATLRDGEVLRVIGYDESIAGPLRREDLDALELHRPIRVQHRTGALWIVDSRTLASLPVELPENAERDADGRATGRFHRADDWLGRHWSTLSVDLVVVSRLLASYGITGVTDMTPYQQVSDLEPLATGAATGAFAQRLNVTGGPALISASFAAGLGVGPVKLVLDESDLPPFDALVGAIEAAHQAGRPVAIHCIGRVVLAVCIAALDQAGTHALDRLEHGSVVPPELLEPLARLRCTVVTQPGFVRSRGDRYLADVEPEDRPHLWPCGSLIDAGVSVAFGTDAPYGPVDPWQAMATATDRLTEQGSMLGPSEAVTPSMALSRFLSPLDDPGAPPREITPGASADLCLLDRPLAEVLASPSDVTVQGTWIAGVAVHAR